MYDIEIKLAKTSVYFTPSQARSYYGRYSRDGITVHWWGDGTGASNHDNIVNYFLRRTDGSVNYVLSDKKITLMVNPDNVAWTSQSGNPTTISIEHQPTLGAEGYKKSGWLVWQLEQRYGKRLALYPHKYWYATACPGTVSLDRIRQEADKWARGYYNAPVPAPTPIPPTTAKVTFTKLSAPRTFVVNKPKISLWRMDSTTWQMPVVKTFTKDDKIEIYGEAYNEKLKVAYWVTKSSYDNKTPNGFSKADLDPFVAPKPNPNPVPEPKPDIPPPAPQQPAWVTNLRDIDDTKYWLLVDQPLIDITTGQPYKDKEGKTLLFEENDEFTASAVTISNGIEYRITSYSHTKGIFNGLPVSSLTLTPPGVPDIPPVPENPDLIKELGLLRQMLQAILDFFRIPFKV
jgi:hypothetical protein